MQILAKTFWLPLNQSSPDGITDLVSNHGIVIPTGNAVFLNCAAFFSDPALAANLDDIGNISSATLSIYQNNALGTLLYQGTVAAASFRNPACTYAAWAAQSDYQFGFELTPEQTNWSITGGTTMNLWWAINVQGANGPVMLGSGNGTAELSGLSATPSTVVNNPTYLTADQVAAQIAAAGVSFLPAITGITGGGAANLDGLAALARPVGQLLQFVLPGQGLQSYQVQSGAVATAAPGIIRPSDFDAETNPKLFVQV